MYFRCIIILSTLLFELVAPIYDNFIQPSVDEQFVNLIRNKRSERMLEVGAGTGGTAQLIRNHCKKLWLLEPAKGMLLNGKKKNLDATWIHGFVEQMPFPEENFDVVYTIDSMHHWFDHTKGFQEIYRVIKPGGSLILIDFDPLKKKGHYIKNMEKVLWMKSRFFSPRELIAIHRQIGFNIEQLTYLDDATYLLVSTKQ